MTVESKTEAIAPPSEETKAAKPHQHGHAHAQGKAYRTAVHEMINTVAHDGGETHAGEFVVAYATEKAEAMYHLENGQLSLQEPKEGQAHFEVSVRDADDDRFVPELDVEITVTAPDGTHVATEKLPMLWHPWLYHYGANLDVPEAGPGYSMEVVIAPPTFGRHDKTNGRRYTEPVRVTFTDVKVPKK